MHGCDHPTQGVAFNALLCRLSNIVSELSQQYEEDLSCAAKKNVELTLAPDDERAGSAEHDQNGGEVFLSEASHITPKENLCTAHSEIFLELEANELIPEEHTCTSQAKDKVGEEHAFEKPRNREKLRIWVEERQHPASEIPINFDNPQIKDPASYDDDYMDPTSSVNWNMLVDVPESPRYVPESSRWGGNSKQKSPNRFPPKSLKRHFHMRSPWIDQREFDHVTLQDVMPEEMFTACLTGTIRMGSKKLQTFDNSVRDRSSHLVLHPESRVHGCWVLACVAFLLYDLVTVPVDVFFALGETTLSKALDIAGATFWTLDIVFTFFVGVRQSQFVEMRPTKIAYIYLKTWFVFDMFLVIPEWVTMVIADDGFSGSEVSVFRLARWGRLMRLLRLARIFKIGRLKTLMRRSIYMLNLSQASIQLMEALAGLSLGLMAYVHITSCLWYAIGNSSGNGWVSVNGLRHVSVGQAYVASVHWSFSRLQGIKAYTEMESTTDNLFDSLLIYTSFVLACYYNGRVVAVAMNRANSQSVKLWMLSIEFARIHRISASLDMKTAKFLESSGAGGAREAAADERMFLESLPRTLRHDLLFEARVPYLSGRPFLKDLLAANPRVIRQICTQAIALKVYLDGEIVFANGDASYGMLFVTSGVLFYSSVDNDNDEALESSQGILDSPRLKATNIADSSAKTIEAYSSASEPVLWTHWTHIGSLFTIEDSTILVLSQYEFSQIVAQHRETLCYAFKYAKQFLWELNNSCDDIDDFTVFQITIHDLEIPRFQGTEFDHLMFLSHYKVEAGTEATLMHDLCQQILRGDPTHSAHNYHSPFFVDSEGLTDLSKLKEHVKGSVALVLLLTPGVLSRPWCLVELVTAVNHNVDILPVEIQRPGSKYDYPDDQFYANILDGNFLEPSAVDVLEFEGISLFDVERTLRKVFNKIALPFSPHKTKGVREAELHDIFSRCVPVSRPGSPSQKASPSPVWARQVSND